VTDNPKVRQTVDVNRETYNRFKERYPYTTFNGMMNLLFEQFMKSENDPIMDEIKEAATNAKEEMRR
jgi:hypothetical protein